jgi:hypothetical protein
MYGSTVFSKKPSIEFLKEAQRVSNIIGIPRDHANIPSAVAKLMYGMADTESAAAIHVAHFQSSKTSVQMGTISMLPWFFGRQLKNPVVGVLHITNKSLSKIFTQTRGRWEDAGFKEVSYSDESSRGTLFAHPEIPKLFVELVMLSGKCWDDKKNAGKFKEGFEKLRAAGCNCFAVVFDEVQIAIKSQQQVDRFLKNCLKIAAPVSPAKYFVPPTVFIGSTATPHKSFVIPVSTQPVLMVYTPPGDGYYGIQDMRDRMQNTPKFEDAQDIVLRLKKYVSKTKPKYFVVRIQPARRSNEYQMALDAAAILGMPVLEYSSAQRNLGELSAKFNSKPGKNIMILIKNAMGAGVTIDTVEHIGAWMDTAYTDMEALTQSIGRLCGYQLNRQSAQFPIFCDTELVDQYWMLMELTIQGIAPSVNEVSEIIGSRFKAREDWFPESDRIEYKFGSRAEALQQARRMGMSEQEFSQARDAKMARTASKPIASYILSGAIITTPTAFVVPGRPSHFSIARAQSKIKAQGGKYFTQRDFDFAWTELIKKYPEVLKHLGDQEYGFFPTNLKFKIGAVPKNRLARNAFHREQD